MNTKTEMIIFIYSLIFIFFKRIYDSYISIVYPIETYVKSGFGFNLIEFRRYLNFISLFWAVYMFLFFRLNEFIKMFLFFGVILNIIYYFLFEDDYIYYFIDKEKTDPIVMEYLDKQVGRVVNFIFLIIYFYVLYKLFPMFFSFKL